MLFRSWSCQSGYLRLKKQFSTSILLHSFNALSPSAGPSNRQFLTITSSLPYSALSSSKLCFSIIFTSMSPLTAQSKAQFLVYNYFLITANTYLSFHNMPAGHCKILLLLPAGDLLSENFFRLSHVFHNRYSERTSCLTGAASEAYRSK